MERKQQQRLEQQLKKWRDDLINLSRTNRLLYFRHTKSASLELEIPPSSQSVFERLEGGGRNAHWEFQLPADTKPGEPPPPPPLLRAGEIRVKDKSRTELLGALRLLERKANQELVDKGLWTLYLGLGVLRWVDADDEKPVHSPLLLLPVRFARASLQDAFRLTRSEEDAVINPALAVKLSTDFGIALPTPDQLDEMTPSTVAEAVREGIRGKKQWEVLDRLVLTTFTFHKEAMYRDLLDNHETISENELIQMLALGPDSPAAGSFDFDDVPEEDLDTVVRPEDLLAIRDADSSQRRAILAARDGYSFVVDGPPGTGKSQTITNVVTELIASGRTVLFVSEKAAALEVVQRRLQEAQLGEFVLELHSHKATRKAVAAELGRALTTRPTARGGFEATALTRLVRSREALSAYALAMNEVRQPIGKSLHDVLGRIVQLQHLPQAPIPSTIGSSVSAYEVQAFLATAETLSRNWAPVARGDGFVWRQLVDTTMSAGRRLDLEQRVREAALALERLDWVVRETDDELRLGLRSDIDDAKQLLEVVGLLEERFDVPWAWLTAEDFHDVSRRADELEQSVGRLKQGEHDLGAELGPDWRSLEPEAALRTAASIEQLDSLEPPLAVEATATSASLSDDATFAERAALQAREILSNAAAIAEEFGLREDDISMLRARDIASLGALAAEPDRPEESWLSPAVQAALAQAAAVLGELVEGFRRQQADLAGVFRSSVLELDLDALAERFSSVHKGLGRLKGPYREDKNALAPHTVAGKATKAAVSRLRDAATWKSFAARLAEAETRHAAVLGTYYERDRADFGEISRAIEVARRAIELAGAGADLGTLRERLGRGAPLDPSVGAGCVELGRRIDQWVTEASERYGETARTLSQLPGKHLIGWLESSQPHLHTVASAIAQIDRVSGGTWQLSSAVDVLSNRLTVASAERTLQDDFDVDSTLLGPLYQGTETDWTQLSRAIEWCTSLRTALGQPARRRTAQALLSSTITADELNDALVGWSKTKDRFLESFDEERQAEIESDLTLPFGDAREILGEFENSIGDVEVWALYRLAVEELEQGGIESVIAFCRNRRLPAEDLVAVIERAILEAWADDVVARDERLHPVQAHERDALVDRFRSLDAALVANAAGRVVNECSRRRPTSTAGAAGVIHREAQKKRKHMPIRELLTRAGTVAQQLKPVFMMSPLSVSQYLPSTLQFDVVIFDEASQVLPSDAINCVYRGRQLIVAGDQKQLPPSSFFMSIGADDEDTYDEEALEDFESVLDLCKAAGGLRSLPLRWHYRSAHESLITYSNYRFYDGSLFTFPGAIEESEDLGVQLIKVDGVYRRGGQRDNPIEASAVVDRVLFHLRNHPHLTLGVVTFSAAQEDAVVAELERRSAAYPELNGLLSDDRLSGFFVKNLENVQGDERDIIVFSVGYGPDENGKFTVQMGPLTKAGGWRRLNVAITRARRRVEIVTSVLPADFPGDVRAEGVRHLKGYLDFAARGTTALALDLQDSAGDAESLFEEEVLRVLRSWGFDAVPQVGVAGYRIDIGVRDPARPGAFLMGIECDGAMYHSSKVARDRDRLRQTVIEGLGWNLHRIWGVSWFRDRPGQEKRLRSAIESAMTEKTTPARVPPQTTPIVDIEEVDFAAPPPWASPYEVARPNPPKYFVEMHDPNARTDLRRMVKEVLDVEAPVHEERVLRIVREAWGVGRSGSRIKGAFDDVLRDLVRRDGFSKGGDGFLRTSEEFEAVRVPSADPETARPVAHLPPEELANAAYWLVSDAHSIGLEEIRLHVARLFGWQRTGRDIAAAVEDAVDRLLEEGYLVEDGDQYRLPNE